MTSKAYMPSEENNIFAGIMGALPYVTSFLAPSHPVYQALERLRKTDLNKLEQLLRSHERISIDGLWKIYFPYIEMGTINSTHLFGLDELILFSFYHQNIGKYHKVADIGANLGLHSMILAQCGYEVRCYEPDEHHLKILQDNIKSNAADKQVSVIAAAVSTYNGDAKFTRVKGNTTSSHLTGAKASPYGELETFSVKVCDFAEITQWADLIKMDVEGHEAELICSTSARQWAGRLDCFLEVGTPENAKLIYEHLKSLDVPMLAQKIGWRRVESLGDIPTSYKQGSLFVAGRTGQL